MKREVFAITIDIPLLWRDVMLKRDDASLMPHSAAINQPHLDSVLTA